MHRWNEKAVCAYGQKIKYGETVMKRRLKQLSAFLICACVLQTLLLCGCGAGDGTAADSGESPVQGENTREYDLFSNEWKGYTQIGEANPKYAVVDTIENICPAPEAGMVRTESCYAVDGEWYYSVRRYQRAGDGEVKYEIYLYSVDSSGGETDFCRLDMKDLNDEAEKGNVYLCALDAACGKLCLFVEVWDPEALRITHYYALWTNSEGIVEKKEDLLTAMQEKLIIDTEQFLETDAHCDGEGNYYLTTGGDPDILIMDAESQETELVTLQDFAGGMIVSSCKTPEGAPVFEYVNRNGATVIFSLNGDKKNMLYTGDAVMSKQRDPDGSGNVLSLDNEKLLCWDAAAGECSILYDSRGTVRSRAVLHETMDEVCLVCEIGEKTCLFRLKPVGEDAEASQTEIVLLLRYDNSYISKCAEAYSQSHPNVILTIQTPPETDSGFWNRTAEEMKAGEGPDLLLIDRSQLVDFKDADLLSELDKILTEDVQSQIFPQVLEYGRIDGRLYGMALETSLGVYIVSDQVWEGDSWTLKDFVDLVKERELQGKAFSGLLSLSYNAGADQLLYNFCLRDLQESPFLDRQQHKCNFETEEFYELLRICKQYGTDSSGGGYKETADRIRDLENGEFLLYGCSGDLLKYSSDRAAFGEGFHCIGTPAEGNGYQTECYECVAMNSRTKHVKETEDFLRYLISEENQAAYTTRWVRRDVIRNRIKEHTEASEMPVFFISEKSVIQLEGRADGSSFAEEYIELMDKSILESTDYEIQGIIMEEAASYFSGDKTEQQVAQAIQNRVQLYLDENG